MSHDLTALEAAEHARHAGRAEGLLIEPLDDHRLERDAVRLAELDLAAYPAGHPDAFEGGREAAIAQMLAVASGAILGRLLPESRIAMLGGDIVGACLVVDRDGTPPSGGPWVVDVFRDPAVPVVGIGRSLLSDALLAARRRGLPGVSLAVTQDNRRALTLYDALGFRDVSESWTVALPPGTG